MQLSARALIRPFADTKVDAALTTRKDCDEGCATDSEEDDDDDDDINDEEDLEDNDDTEIDLFTELDSEKQQELLENTAEV
jgi:hypothetical protein